MEMNMKNTTNKIVLHVYPKLFEYDHINKIVDVFVKEDKNCPYPFITSSSDLGDKAYHQGFRLEEFVIFLNDFFKRAELPYKVISFIEKNCKGYEEEKSNKLNQTKKTMMDKLVEIKIGNKLSDIIDKGLHTKDTLTEEHYLAIIQEINKFIKQLRG